MPATAQVADGAMDEGRIVLWMGDGYFGRCQIDESKVLAAAAKTTGPVTPLSESVCDVDQVSHIPVVT